MIKRASAARKVATGEGSRPGSTSLFVPTLRALGGQVPPGQLTSSSATGGISGELCSCVDHLRGGDGAVCGYQRGI
jgi:hypothetical protein